MAATITTTTTIPAHKLDCIKQNLSLVIPATTESLKTTTSASTNASASVRTSSQGTVAINYLPSFRRPCKNVPTRTTTAEITTAQRIQARTGETVETKKITTKLYNETVNTNTRHGVSSCCCHRWEHENDYIYEKHAMTPSMTTRRQLPQQPNKHDTFSLSHQHHHHHHYNNNNNNDSNSGSTTTTTTTKNADYNCIGKSHRVSQLVLLKKQQRYNDLLSAYQRAHNNFTNSDTNITTHAITNTKTNKLITLAKKDAYYSTINISAYPSSNATTIANASSMSASLNVQRHEQLRIGSDLTIRNDVRLLNYATRKCKKARTNNFQSSETVKPTDENERKMAENVHCQRLLTHALAESTGRVCAAERDATFIDNGAVTRNFTLLRSKRTPAMAARQLTTATNTTNRTSSIETYRCSNSSAGNGQFGDSFATNSGDGSRCNSNFTCHKYDADSTCPMMINTTKISCSIFFAVIYLCYCLWLKFFRRQLLQNLWQQMSFHLRMTTKFPTTKWLLSIMLLMLTTSVNCWAGRQDVPTNCTFPARWEGSWFLSGYQQSIHIKGSQFSYRGKCAASDGNKYLIVDEKGCHRCLVIYEKHKNVLQYKESECEGDSIYMHQSNPSALAMRSVLKQTEHRGGAHPNINGHSRLSSSDQYIMRSNDDMNDYFCKGRETLQNLCDQIPGDALLYSLFRESAEPVKCPLKGPFIFTYNRGHGECKSPVSNIESCTEESRLLLSFQACPDVQGTESTVEELTCLATWKDGNSRYLVGLVSHHHAISNEERYRCFVYEKISPLMGGPSLISPKDAEYKLAQSGDATCNGLDSAEVGSRIMSLRKPPLAERCDFPVWFKGPRHWHGLMGNSVYNYHSNDGSIHIIKPNGYMETRALCEQINKQTSTEMMAVVHYTTGCLSGFMCMMFFRRDTHVIEIQTGKQASRLEDACAPDYFDIHKMAYITLLASNPEQQICPMEGLYNLRGAIGPPYMTTRHKRNHNNKIHAGHGHHHQLNEEANTNLHGSGFTHKRHSTLSFRNGDKILERTSWHANTRGLPVRSRRNTPINDDHQHADVASGRTELLLKDTIKSNETAIDLILRNRRNVPGCITNVKAQRQLWIGCTDHDIIDVRPLCNDDGDEVYSCHGSWSENGTVHIIARHKSTKHGVCISYRPTEGTSAKLYIGDTCYRGAQKVPDHILEANLSVFGKCGETGSSSKDRCTPDWSLLTAVLIITTLLAKSQVHLETAACR